LNVELLFDDQLIIAAGRPRAPHLHTTRCGATATFVADVDAKSVHIVAIITEEEVIFWGLMHVSLVEM
jgi:hypothetical protein